MNFRELMKQAYLKAKGLSDKAKAENRDLTDVEQSAFDLAMSDYTKYKSKVEEEEALEAAGNHLNALQPTSRIDPLSIRDRVQDDPRAGFRNEVDFFLSVLNEGRTNGRNFDPRLRPLAAAGSDEQSTFDDSYGGFLVPEEFRNEILQVMAEADPTAALVREIPMGASTVKIPARKDKNHTSSVTGGVRAYRRAEADTVAASRMQFDQVKLEAESMMVLSYVTEELLQDSPQSIAALMTQAGGDEIASQLFYERIYGTGVGEFLGVLNAPALVSIAKETGQAAATVVYNNIVKMVARCWRYSSAIWIVNHEVLPQLLLMNMSVGTGGIPIFHTNGAGPFPNTLLGRPLIFSEYAEALGTKGDIILANWSEYIIGNYGGVNTAESIHVRFVNNERAFRWTMRNDGRPWWNGPMTPKKGSSTISPFVTLDARTA